MSKRPAPTKAEIVSFKVLEDAGCRPHAIGKAVGRDPKTIARYLRITDFAKPELADLLEHARKTELSDLELLVFKARRRLHEYLDKGPVQPIPALAIADRCFNQRQVLLNRPTEILSTREITLTYQEQAKRLDEFLRFLDAPPKTDAPSERQT